MAVLLPGDTLSPCSEIGTGLQNASGIRSSLARAGYAFVEASEMRTALGRFGTLADWPAFAASWNDLHTDRYMADGGRYRRRRFGVFAAAPAASSRAAAPAALSGPRLQHAERRHRALVRAGHAAIGDGASCARSSASARRCSRLRRRRPWHVEAHQFRIEARTANRASRRPEGMHRDGVDWVLVLLIDRAISRAARPPSTRRPAHARQLHADRSVRCGAGRRLRVYHGVTPVEPENPAQPAYRDVLVVTFRKRPTA